MKVIKNTKSILCGATDNDYMISCFKKQHILKLKKVFELFEYVIRFIFSFHLIYMHLQSIKMYYYNIVYFHRDNIQILSSSVLNDIDASRLPERNAVLSFTSEYFYYYF